MKAKWKWLFVNLLIITTIVFTASISAFGFTTQKEENEIKPLVGWLQEIWDTIFSSNHLTYGPFEINGNRYIYKGEPIIGDYELDGPLRIDADMELNSHISAKEIEINAEVNVGYSKSLDYPYITYGKLESLGDIKINRKGSLVLKKGTNVLCNRNLISKSEKAFSLTNGTITVLKNFDLRNKWESAEECIVKIKGPEKHVLKGDETVSIGNLIFTEDSLLRSVVKKKFFQEPFLIERWGIQFSDTMQPSRIPELNEYMQMTVSSSNVPAEIIAYAQIYIYKLLICDNDFGIDIMNTFFKVKTDPESAAYVDLHSASGEKGIYLDSKNNVHVVTLDVSYIGTRNGKKGNPFGFASLNIHDGSTYTFYFTPNTKYIDSTADDFVTLIRQGASEAIKDQVKDIAIGQIITDIADLSSAEVFDFEPGIALCNNVEVYEFLKKYGDHVQDWNRVNKGLQYDASSKTKIQAKEEHPEGANEISSEGYSDAIQLETDDGSKQISPYIETIDNLISQYGSLRIVQNNREWQNEANGLCYLNLIDFTGDGEDELIAVCKNEDEEHYTGYIYTLNNGKAELIYENPQIEYNFYQGFDLVSLGYAEDTGFIFGTGWVDADADDLTYFWYKNGAFEPVYRSKRTYDGNIEDYIVDEYQAKVDIYDDDHTEKLWERFPTITLRTKSDIDVDGNYYDSHELRKSIDDVIRRLDVSPAELPPDLGLPGMDAIADAEIYFCLENEIDQWEPSIENDEYFWSVIGNYGLSEPRIDDLNPIVTWDIGDAFILDKSIIENAAYASFSDFSGSLPQFRSYPDMWLVREVGEQTVTLGYGESGVMTERKSYEVNDDKSIDVIYTALYFQDGIEPIADYSVHMVFNPNYNKNNDFFTYYYTVTNIEKIKDYTETPATTDEEAENDGVDPAITDISQVIDMNLTAAEAAHELGLNYEVEDDSEYYFYADRSCDESQGMLWCYGYQYDQNNNWKYQPGDSGISVYGLNNEMSEEEFSSIINKTHFSDVANYFGGDENDKFYYETNQNEFVIAGKVQDGAIIDLAVFSAIDY